MQTTVYLVRHGEVEYRLDHEGKKLIYGPSASLSYEGRQQLVLLAKTFRALGVSPDAFYTSSFSRAVQSATILCSHLGSGSLTMWGELCDVWMPGWWDTKTMEFLEQHGGTAYSLMLTPDQETLTQMTERITRAINRIISRERGKTIVTVSHGDPLRAYVDRLFHPERPEPVVTRDDDYLGKGRAWKLVFDDQLKLASHEKVEGVHQTLPEVKF